MGQEINTHRFLTIAGSVTLVALTAYGVWKWNKAGNFVFLIQGHYILKRGSC